MNSRAFIALVCFSAVMANSQTWVDVNVSWPPSGESTVAGYDLYWQKVGLTTSVANPDLRLAVISSSQNATASYTGTVYTLGCASGGFHQSVDEGVMGYSLCEGDFTFSAKITRLDNTDPRAKAGIMIRSKLYSSATYIATLITPANRVWLQTNIDTLKSKTGLTIGNCWFRARRSDDSISMETSADGVGYNLLGKVAWLEAEAFVGVAQTSATFSATGTADFSNISVLTSFGPVNNVMFNDTSVKSTQLTGRIEKGFKYRFYLMTMNEYGFETPYRDTVMLDLTGTTGSAPVAVSFGASAIHPRQQARVSPRIITGSPLFDLQGRKVSAAAQSSLLNRALVRWNADQGGAITSLSVINR